jgi:hypothetical protein
MKEKNGTSPTRTLIRPKFVFDWIIELQWDNCLASRSKRIESLQDTPFRNMKMYKVQGEKIAKVDQYHSFVGN